MDVFVTLVNDGSITSGKAPLRMRLISVFYDVSESCYCAAVIEGTEIAIYAISDLEICQ